MFTNQKVRFPAHFPYITTYMQMWNCQWMADFAALDEKRPEEVFIFNCCDPSKIKVRPKDRSKVTADSVIRELDPFVACALELALIDRD